MEKKDQRKLSEEVVEKLSIFKNSWPMLRNNLRIRERKEKVLHEISLDLHREVRKIKEENIDRLTENIEKLRKVLESRGAELRIARDGLEASRMVVELCRQYNVNLVVKSKSLTTEEIELNKLLESGGIEVVETDLGERIVQLAGQRPSHILGPAFHLTRYEVAEIFSRYYGREIPSDPREIVSEVRKEFREKYVKAGMAITGANIIVAENGAVILVTNEGNDRLSVAFAPIHVVITGVEKVVSTMKDALKILKILPRNATGQRLSSYVSFHIPNSISYPREGLMNARRMIYILIDNGRLLATKDENIREALYCIRCSSCLQVCPPYNMVGGHVFGYIYSGPMGIPWTMITNGLENTEFAQLCNFCGLCKEACPVDIDLPYLNSIVKERFGKKYGYPWTNKFLKRYESFIAIAGKMPNLSNVILSLKPVRKFMEAFVGIDSRRNLPRFSKKDLGMIFREMGSGEKGSIALFTDALVYYMHPEWGLKASEILAKLDFKVVLPKQKSSGMPLIQYGFMDEARKVANYNINMLYRLVEEGYKVVSIEPTAHYCLTYYYPKLLNNHASEKVAENSYGFFEFIKNIGLNKVKNLLESLEDKKIIYHLPCHSRTRDGSLATKEFIEELGADVLFKNLGCCGLAGTWGMKKKGHGYDISIAIGNYVVGQYEEMGGDMIVTESSICLEQLNYLSQKPCKHIFEIINLLSRKSNSEI